MKLHSKELPEYLSSGEWARLIPFGSSGEMEAKVTSVFLAALASVREFPKSVFEADKILRIGAQTKIDVWTEVVFKDSLEDKKFRPDGLIVINSGRNQWRALVEAKIGNNELKKEQINNYLSLAKQHGIDAVITLSNQYVVDPRHHPIDFKKQELKNRELYHFSWVSILTHARLLLSNMEVKDVDQKFILTEMVRCFEDRNSKISEFVNMNPEWSDVVNKVQRGAAISKNSEEVKNTINAWHQESKNLCLIMSRELDVYVSQYVRRKYIKDSALRLKEDCEKFCKNLSLSCYIEVPNAAAPIKIVADLQKRNITCSMSLNAPDSHRSETKLNWLLKQLKKTKDKDVFIRAVSSGRADNPHFGLKDIRENLNLLLNSQGVKIQPVSFDVVMMRDCRSKFGRKDFIKSVESLAENFYKEVGEHLKAWRPAPPKMKDDNSEKSSHTPDNTENVSVENFQESSQPSINADDKSQ